MELFRLVGSIFVDNTEANKSIQKTDKNATSLGDKFKKGITTVAKWGAGIATAAGVAGAAMVKAAKNQAANLDVIDKASIRMGISAEKYQELAYAAELCGVEMSTMEKAAKKLEGTDLNMDDAINQLMSITDESERTKAAIDLFGESVAYQMTPLLQAGAEGMAGMRQEANDLGLVMSQDTVTAGAAMNDAFTKIDASLGAVKNSIVQSVMPYVQKLLDWVIEHMPEIQETVHKVVTKIGEIMENLKPIIKAVFEAIQNFWNTILKPVFEKIFNWIRDHMPQIKEFIRTAIDTIKGIIESLKPVLVALWNTASEIWNNYLKPILEAAFNWVRDHMPEIKQFIKDAVDAIKKVIETIKPVVEGVFNGIAYIWTNTLKPILESIIAFVRDVFKGNWSNIWNDIKNIFGAVFEGMKGLFKAPINWIIDRLNSFIRGVNKIKIPSWVPGVGGKGISISTIPRLAQGGVLEKGQVGILEGSGAEAVVPLEQNRKWISAIAEDMNANGLGGNKETVELLTKMLDKLDNLMNMGVYIDGRTLVGEIAPNMDTELGRLATRNGRFV